MPTHTLRQPLVTRVYSPEGDNLTNRPLVIYLHTGNFFPFPANGSCGGTIDDSCNVEIATRLAKMGYVVAVADYRTGWLPFSTVELVRRWSLINGAYRGVQDVSTCIRYFRRNVAEAGNTFGIDPSKIVVWGQGTGGYLSMAAAYLNTYGEILTTSDPTKFLLPTPSGSVPMVIEGYNGNIDGTTGPHIADATYNALSGGFVPAGDTLCVANHPGFSSDFALAVNMGGALGDSTWIDAGEIPLISFHNPTDFFAPCGTDILNVPTATGSQPVVEVSGSCDVQSIVKKNNLNAIFNTIPAGYDPVAASSTSSLNGFFPFNNTPNNSASPWEWKGLPNTPPTPADCNIDAVSSRAYIDTIIGYYAPRACVALGLGCNFSSTNELNVVELGLSVSPVPSADAVTFSTEKEPIRSIYIYDLNGRLVKAHTNIDNNVFRMERNSLVNGLYIAELQFDQGFAKRRIVFTNN